ncbi:hypothetical protein AYO49_05640 [Verrucomicrobiaceae bacterium SCGC AG-212-N21]|nr:hypothetical protein AYO49_05640 [Verrucomicrobiaceae bacterium SCGC AG-212-N21]
MNEEHMSFEQALWFPLAAGVVLLMAAGERRGAKTGRSFVDQAIARATRATKRYLQENFEIV